MLDRCKGAFLALVDNLLQAYEQDLKTLPWMTPETRQKALEKLHQFTVKVGTSARTAVGYNTVYSDGNNSRQANYYGGNKGGVILDGSGVYKDTFVLSPAAAPGVAQVVVAATTKSNGNMLRSSFVVADAAGHC